MSKIRGSFVTVEGIRLHYMRKGKGVPVVFLHGGILCADDFKEVMEIAASCGYEAIAFDRPGYGYSEMIQQVGHMIPQNHPEIVMQALDTVRKKGLVATNQNI